MKSFLYDNNPPYNFWREKMILPSNHIYFKCLLYFEPRHLSCVTGNLFSGFSDQVQQIPECPTKEDE